MMLHMQDWKMTTIAECSTILGDGLHGTPKYDENGEYAFINGNNLHDGKIVIKPDTKCVGFSEYEKHKKELTDRTVLVSINGTLGNIAVYNGEKVILGKSACYFNVSTDCDVQFMRYVVSSPRFQQYINSVATGTTIKNVSLKQMREYSFLIPELEEQQRIAKVLNLLDQKIENNQKINDNLYAQARTITNQWISENDNDYELLPLSEVAAINPDTYSPKEEWEYVNYLDTSSITDGYITDNQRITPSTEKLPSRARRIIVSNDVVFSTVRPNQRHFGIISEPLPNMLASTGFAVIRSKNPLVCNELIYLCLTDNAFIDKMQQLAEQSTSTFPSIKPSDLGVCEIPCPKDDSSSSLTETLKAMFALIAANHRENASLVELRDSLLPKLMAGEIDVSNIQL